MKQARIVSAGPTVSYARRKRVEADTTLPTRMVAQLEGYVEDALPAMAALLGESSEVDAVMGFAAKMREELSENPNMTAAMVGYLLVRLVRAENVTADAARFRPDKNGDNE